MRYACDAEVHWLGLGGGVGEGDGRSGSVEGG